VGRDYVRLQKEIGRDYGNHGCKAESGDVETVAARMYRHNQKHGGSEPGNSITTILFEIYLNLK
jgi:hypothetical protein